MRNKKRLFLAKTIFFVLFAIQFQTSLCFGSTSPIEIRISDAKHDAATLEFHEATNHTITIINDTKEAISLDNMIFIGDDITSGLINNSLSTEGYNNSITIPPDTTYSFIITAERDANPTVNENGEQLILSYYSHNDDQLKFIPIRVKIKYNDNLHFQKRNLIFEDGDLMSNSNVQKLILINRNPKSTLHVTDIHVANKNVAMINSGYKGNCANLKTGGSCELDIAANPHAQTGMTTPIWVTYDLDGLKGLKAVAQAYIVKTKPNSVIQPLKEFAGSTAENVIAITNSLGGITQLLQNLYGLAAKTHAAIQSIYNNDQTQSLQATIDGAASAVATKLVYIETAIGPFKPILVTAFKNKHVPEIGLGLPMGFGYALADFIANVSGKKPYDSKVNINKAVEATTLQTILGLLSCGGNGACVLATIGCGVTASFSSKAIMEYLIPNFVTILPEQEESIFSKAKNKLKLPITFGISTAIRLPCKALAHVKNGGLIELVQEILSGGVLTSVDETKSMLFSKTDVPYNITSENNAKLPDYICLDKMCVCSYVAN